jgi:hypothetical protein
MRSPSVCLSVRECQSHAIASKASGGVAPSKIFDVALRWAFECFKIDARFYQFCWYEITDVITENVKVLGACPGFVVL